MFRKMLVATDLSEASHKVVEALGGLRALGVEEAVLLHCINFVDTTTYAPDLLGLPRRELESQQRKLEEQGFGVVAEVAIGMPHSEIQRRAQERDCGLIVIGSHGESATARILLGGVAEAVLRNAVLPVLVVRIKLKQLGDREVCEFLTCDFRGHLLHPTDFSSNAARAHQTVVDLAEAGVAKVTLLHVVEENDSSAESTARERLDSLRESLTSRTVGPVEMEVRRGNPKKEIVARIGEGDVSLVIMGSQGRSRLAELFLGSVSHEVAQRSTVPVLIVPLKR